MTGTDSWSFKMEIKEEKKGRIRVRQKRVHTLLVMTLFLSPPDGCRQTQRVRHLEGETTTRQNSGTRQNVLESSLSNVPRWTPRERIRNLSFERFPLFGLVRVTSGTVGEQESP